MAKTLHSAEFKKKVALEALREDQTLAQIASAYGIHPVQVCKWKKMLLDGAASLFSDPKKHAMRMLGIKRLTSARSDK
jgi:transposase